MSGSRLDRRRRGLDQRALLHHRRQSESFQAQGARAAQGRGTPRRRTAATPRSRFTGRRAGRRAGCRPRSPTLDAGRRPTELPRAHTPMCATALGSTPSGDGLVVERQRHRLPRVRSAGDHRARAAAVVAGAAGRDGRGPARPRTPGTCSTPLGAGRRRRRGHLGGAAASRRSSSPTSRRRSRWCSAGRWLLLAERERWPEGRYLAVDLQLVLRAQRRPARRRARPRADLPVGRVARARRRRQRSGGTGVLEESVKHTVGVSKDLREGVRLSIEIIANEVVRRRARARARPAAGRSRRSRWPSSRCASSTASCSCSTPRRRPSWACCRSARRVRRRATASTGCAS